MKESISNIALICSNCTSERHIEWQENNKDLKIVKGDWCKIAFQEGKQVEWMWIEITSIRGNTFYGTLDNDPFIITAIKDGDKVKFLRNQIAEHLKK